jgi:hypothetical protein
MQWIATRGRQGFYMSMSRRGGLPAGANFNGNNSRQRPSLAQVNQKACNTH